MSTTIAESRYTHDEIAGCAPWCIDHQDDPPEDGWCRSERLEVAGIETHVTNGNFDRQPSIRLVQNDYAPDLLTARQARHLAERLLRLAERIDAD